MKAIIAGGRNFVGNDKHMGWLIYMSEKYKVAEVVSGGASGADEFGEDFAKMFNIPVKRFHADWDNYGKAAGPIRNQEMAKYADLCILFPGGKGTESMRGYATDYGLTVEEWRE